MSTVRPSDASQQCGRPLLNLRPNSCASACSIEFGHQHNQPADINIGRQKNSLAKGTGPKACAPAVNEDDHETERSSGHGLATSGRGESFGLQMRNWWC
jgi:hypothetical protein